MLSTCNRTEIYARAHPVPPGVDDVRHFLAELAGVDPDSLAERLYTYHDDAAVAHLFAVAAGLDSMIIGEGEILGQVREAWQTAEQEGTAGQLLVAGVPPRRRGRQAGPPRDRHRPPRRSRCRRPRWRSPPSASGRSRAGRVLVLGAGRGRGGHGGRAGRRGGRRDRRRQPQPRPGPGSCARRVGGRAIPLDEIPDALVDADVLLASTGAPERPHRAGRHRGRHGAPRRPRRCSSSTWPCPATSTRASGRSSAITLLDIEALRGRSASSRSSSAAPRSARSAPSSPTSSTGSALERSAREVAPLVAALARPGRDGAQAAELRAPRRRARRPRPRRPRDAIEAVTRAVREQAARTSRPCG